VEQEEFVELEGFEGADSLHAPEGRQYIPTSWLLQSVSLEHARQVSVLGPDDVQMGVVEEQLVLLVHCTQ
jgi:hypothetical protein